MKIVHATCFEVSIPFKESIAHQLKARQTTCALVLEVVTEGGIQGYGEGAPRAYVTGESMEELLAANEQLLPTLTGRRFSGVVEVATYVAELRMRRSPSLVCAVELALLDALGQEEGRSVGFYLPVHDGARPTYSGILPFVAPDKLPRWLQLLQHLQLKTLKVKVGREDDVERLAQIRKVFGPELDIRLDANQAWSAAEAPARIEALLPFGPTWIEEPLVAAHRNELPLLANTCPIPVSLDESLTSLEDATFFAETIPPEQLAFNLKLSKLGGIFGAATVQQLAQENNIPCQLGCHVGETAILTAAGRHFAQHYSLQYLEGAYAPFFMEDDLGVFPISFAAEGAIDSLTGAGLGITVVNEKLAQYSARQLSPIT